MGAQSSENLSVASFGNEDHRFKKLAEEYASIVNGVGAKCIPYEDPSLPLFSKASLEKKLSAITFLENAVSVFQEIKANHGSIRDNRTLIWRSLNRLKLVPDMEVFDKMGDGDVIEIYSLPDHCHLAWNVLLMDQASFTAEQLLCQAWWELSSRPAEVVTEFQRLSKILITQDHVSTFVPNVPVHRVQELNSRELLTKDMEIKYISPLRRDGRNAAFLVIINSKVIGSQKRIKKNE